MGTRAPSWRPALVGVVTLSLLASLAVVEPDPSWASTATPSDEQRRAQGIEDAPDIGTTDVVASTTLTQARPAPVPRVVAAGADPVVWPDESTAVVEVEPSPEAGADRRADDGEGAAPLVQVEQVPEADDAPTPPAAVEVHVADQGSAVAAGVDGLLLDLTPVAATAPTDPGAESPEAVEPTRPSETPAPSSSPTAEPTPGSTPAAVEQTAFVVPHAAAAGDTADPAAAPVQVTVDYGSFADAYGGDWSSRLRLVSMPSCALTTPSRPACRTQTEIETVNDLSASTVAATVSLASARTLAVSAATSGATGNWSATSLSPSATWQVSPQTGDFSWTYPLRVAPSVGGPAPDLSLSYSSGSIDGKVASTNNQTSWVGDGWDLTSGYVERSYVPCAQDTVGGNNAGHPTGDLCWSTDNASLVFNGSASPLVKDAATGTWRAQSDDGTKVERLTGAANGDDDGEYWKVTTTDGTQYVFGRGQRSATDTTALNSAWNVPVYGNHPSDPCYAGSFAASVCTQTWRWNLEYVVDASGNSLTYFYTKESNQYGRDLNSAVSTYDRGGYLARIEYGQRSGSETAAAAPQRVDFTVAERCLPSGSVTCDPAQLTAANAKSWPDVPFDLICTSTASCPGVTSPAFFTRKRLTQVTTKVLSGSAYQSIDAWTLTQTYPDPGDSTSPSLWLAKIGHTGTVGTAIALPDVTFSGVQMANRVDALGDYGPPMNHYRISSISSESGGTTSVNYTPTDCSSTDLPAAPDSNTRRCFPVMWTPEGSFTSPVQEYFHKYLVDSVVANGNDGTSAATETHYSYVGGAAWHHDDNPLVPPAQRTWGQFRGYGTVDVVDGAASDTPRSWTRYRYFRGMDGDRIASGGARTVLVDGIADRERLNGFQREQITYDGEGGPEVSGAVTTPWVSPATATGADGRSATFLGAAETETRTTAPELPGGVRTTRTTTSYDDAYGMVTQVDDQGDVATSADDRCTRVEYARNATANVVATVRRSETVSVSCAVAPARPADVVSDTRTLYDGGAYGDAPTRGRVTATQSLSSYSAGSPVYVTDATTTYDAIGRATAQTDALGRTTITAYTPATGGPVTQTTVTSPDPDGTGPLTAQSSVTVNNPAWGVPTKVTDPNGKVTTSTYDALGRLTAVWLPGRVQGSVTASSTYAYTVSKTAPDAVSTSTLTAAGTYLTSVQLYDGLLRLRQTQSPSAARDTAGRVVTDTVYDSRGLVAYENGSWFTTGSPGTAFVAPTEAIPSRTRHLYDGAERETATVFEVGDHERWRTTTTYGGDRVSTDPPPGGVAQTTITDARGQTTELRQYTSGAPTGAYAATTYGYDGAGRLASVHDAAGNAWTYSYDLLGRQIASTDPDKGASSSTYDAAGQQLTTTDARGTTLASTYDQLGRRTSLRDGSATGALRATWTYDTLAKGRLTSSTRYVGAAAYVTAVTGYDDGYRPLGQSVTLPSTEGALAGTYTTSYTYTPDGQVATVKLPAGGGLTAETDTIHYDAANLPEWMNGSLGYGVYVADSLYSSYGQLMQVDLGNTYANYVNYDYEYGTNRLARTWLVRQNVTGNDVDLRYTYDDAGNTTKVVDQPTGQSADNQCFTYDGLNRLASAWTPSSGSCSTTPTVAGLGGPAPYWTDYAIDPVGNRLSTTGHTAAATTTDTYAYPAVGSARPHAVTSVSRTSTSGPTATSTYGYDATGNTTARAVAGSSAQSLTWDAEGRLATVTQGSATSSYVYTAGGDRLVRKQSGTTTVYLPGGQELTLTTATATVTGTRYYSFAGQTVAVRTGQAGSTVSSLVSDPHQTATVSIGNTTQVVTKRRFDPFGNVRGTKPAWPGDHAFLNKPLDTSGLSSVGARYYDASLGRFISVDPVMDLGSPQQWAAYSYADNNPITYWDPTGLFSWGKAWKSANQWVKKHQVEIVGVVVGTVVTGTCLAASWGVGSVGCAALGGAAGWAASNLWRSQVQRTQKFSWGSLALETGIGAAAGTVSPGLGKIASSAVRGIRQGAVAAGSRVVGSRAGASSGEVVASSRGLAAGRGVRPAASGHGGTGMGAPAPTGAGQGAGDTMELFRAVGVREYESVMSSGRFTGGGASLEARQFATNQSEALAYADADLSKVSILRATVRRDAVEGVADFSLDIDVSIFRNGVYTVQPGLQSDIFHAGLLRIDHVL